MGDLRDEEIKVYSTQIFLGESSNKEEVFKKFTEIESMLSSDESIKNFISDFHNDRNIMIFCTNLRLICLNTLNDVGTKEIFLNKIKYIESDFDSGYGKMKVSSENEILEIEGISENSVRSILLMIKESKTSEDEIRMKKIEEFNLTEQIEKLNGLREKSIISTEEFERAKASLVHQK